MRKAILIITIVVAVVGAAGYLLLRDNDSPQHYVEKYFSTHERVTEYRCKSKSQDGYGDRTTVQCTTDYIGVGKVEWIWDCSPAAGSAKYRDRYAYSCAWTAYYDGDDTNEGTRVFKR